MAIPIECKIHFTIKRCSPRATYLSGLDFDRTRIRFPLISFSAISGVKFLSSFWMRELFYIKYPRLHSFFANTKEKNQKKKSTEGFK